MYCGDIIIKFVSVFMHDQYISIIMTTGEKLYYLRNVVEL